MENTNLQLFQIPDFYYVGSKLKAARKFYDLTLSDVAKEIGCSFQNLSAIENGKLAGKFFIFYIVFLQNKGLDLNSIFNVHELKLKPNKIELQHSIS